MALCRDYICLTVLLSETVNLISMTQLKLYSNRFHGTFCFFFIYIDLNSWGFKLFISQLLTLFGEISRLSRELSKSQAKKVWGPKLSSHGIYIPNGCKHFKLFLQLCYGSEANSNKLLKNEKISGIERLVLPFPHT